METHVVPCGPHRAPQGPQYVYKGHDRVIYRVYNGPEVDSNGQTRTDRQTQPVTPTTDDNIRRQTLPATPTTDDNICRQTPPVPPDVPSINGGDTSSVPASASDNVTTPTPPTAVRRTTGHDEIEEYIEARYCSASEACWRTFSFKMGGLYPVVQRLPVHEEECQNVLFTSDKEKTQEALRAARVTKLTAFFTVCWWEKNHYPDGNIPVRVLKGGPPTREIKYQDVGKWFKWKTRDKEAGTDACWIRRKRPSPKCVGRVRYVAPTGENKELFHLRM